MNLQLMIAFQVIVTHKNRKILIKNKKIYKKMDILAQSKNKTKIMKFKKTKKKISGIILNSFNDLSD